MTNQNELKRLAAEAAVEKIQSGMVIGLGTGSTNQFAIKKIAEKIKSGELKNIVGVPTSKRTEQEATRLGIPLTTLDELYISHSERSEELNYVKVIDITIDGADEVDESLNLIKGGGGALLHEKVIAQASKENFIVVDESKLSKNLGEKFFVPVEVLQFALQQEVNFLESLGAKISIRKNSDGKFYITDENNFIVDANFGVIKDPVTLSQKINERAGIVEHGIFIGLATNIFCSTSNGKIIIKEKF